MGTDIKITKKIGVKNQDTPITTDTSNINFKGAGVTSTAVGDEVTVVITGGGGGSSTNLSYVPAVNDGTVTSDTGTNATIPLADATNAGLMLAAEKTKLAIALVAVGVDYRGAYNNGDGTYGIDSVVLYNNYLYEKISNPGNPGYPPSGPDWQLFEPLIGSPAFDLWINNILQNKVNTIAGKGLSTEDYTTAEKTKLSGIATSATANDTDANLKNRANHTGTQTASTISDIQSTITNNTQVLANTAKISFDSTSSTRLANTSGTNTGDETNTSIKTKLGITTLSGTNTGDQDLSGLVVKANNLSDLTNTTTARTNLGLGSLATQSGTFSGTSSGTNTGDQTLVGLGGVASNTAITGATKTKVTYDAKGLVTAGADATTADIAASTNKNYVTDAQAVVIGNTSGTNTGDNAVNSLYSGLAASKQDVITLTTTGTSGAATLIGSTLNVPQYSGGGSSQTLAQTLVLGNSAGTTDINMNNRSITNINNVSTSATTVQMQAIVNQTLIFYSNNC